MLQLSSRHYGGDYSGCWRVSAWSGRVTEQTAQSANEDIALCHEDITSSLSPAALDYKYKNAVYCLI